MRGRDGEDANYGVYSKATARNLHVGHLALPSSGGRGVDFVPLMPKDWQLILASPELFEGKASGLVRMPRTMVADYPAFLVELKGKGMVQFAREPSEHCNGWFGVPKEGVESPLNRVIYNCVLTNDITMPLPKVSLPNPSDLASIPSWVTGFVNCDLESFYHYLLMPESWRKHFGMKRVRGYLVGIPDVDWVYPECVTLPMGWTDSVGVAQVLAEELFAKWSRQFLGVLKFVNLKDKEAVSRVLE
jgi:hypothetical protein